MTRQDGWKWSFNDLPKNDEDGKEIEYSISEDVVTDYTSEITEDSESTDPNSEDPNSEEQENESTLEIKSFTVTNTYNPDKTQVNVTKVWDDGDDQDGIRPDSVTVKLLADGEEVTGPDDEPLTLELSEDNDWTGSFKDLPVTKLVPKETTPEEPEADPQENPEADDPDEPEENELEKPEENEPEEPEEIEVPIEYTVTEQTDDQVITEEDGPGTYAFDVSGDVEKGFTVTNTHTPETRTIEVTKVWEDEDDQDGKRPESVTIRLLADGGEVSGTDDEPMTLELSEDNDWTGSFEDLPKKKDGVEIEYTVKEDESNVITGEDAPGTYAYDIEESEDVDGFTVTNTHTPETLTIEGEKTWEDEDDKDGRRPESITIRLKADGEEQQSIEIMEESEWKWSFEDLPKYKDGREIEYTISEDKVDAYTSEIDGYNVTNTYTPGKTQVT